jgi:hypothetical protein
MEQSPGLLGASFSRISRLLGASLSRISRLLGASLSEFQEKTRAVTLCCCRLPSPKPSRIYMAECLFLSRARSKAFEIEAGLVLQGAMSCGEGTRATIGLGSREMRQASCFKYVHKWTCTAQKRSAEARSYECLFSYVVVESVGKA